jgi:hypothetical protein
MSAAEYRGQLFSFAALFGPPGLGLKPENETEQFRSRELRQSDSKPTKPTRHGEKGEENPITTRSPASNGCRMLN